MSNPIEIEKSKLEKEPCLAWNAFIELITIDTEELSEIQSIAHLAFYYDSEVQNGGHLQYFENIFNLYKGKEEIIVSTTLQALKIIGAKKQYGILFNASNQYFSKIRKHPETVDDFVELELEDEFEKFDNRYYDCLPNMSKYLEDYLETHINEFIKLI